MYKKVNYILHFLTPGAGSGIRIPIRIHKVIESRSYPDPQPRFQEQVFIVTVQ
jgi:hypothetical protein